MNFNQTARFCASLTIVVSYYYSYCVLCRVFRVARAFPFASSLLVLFRHEPLRFFYYTPLYHRPPPPFFAAVGRSTVSAPTYFCEESRVVAARQYIYLVLSNIAGKLPRQEGYTTVLAAIQASAESYSRPLSIYSPRWGALLMKGLSYLCATANNCLAFNYLSRARRHPWPDLFVVRR